MIYKFNCTTKIFFEKLISSENFRNEIINIFIDSQFTDVFWEFPQYSANTSNNLAEFMLIESFPFGQADSSSFAEHLKNKEDNQVVIFKNLSGDTKLIAINSHNTGNQTFCHIMEFMKKTSYENKHNLLIKIGKEMIIYTNSTKPVYLSTHGHGVPWLHVRICSKPKYYCGNYSNS